MTTLHIGKKFWKVIPLKNTSCKRCKYFVRTYSESNVKPDPYHVLGLERNATVDDIRIARIRESTKYHQLIGGGETETTSKYIQVQDSYREIMEDLHKSGALVKSDATTLMPYDFSIKPFKIENAPDKSRFTVKKLIYILLGACVLFGVIKYEHAIKQKFKRIPKKEDIVETIRWRTTKEYKRNKNIDDMRKDIAQHLNRVIK